MTEVSKTLCSESQSYTLKPPLCPGGGRSNQRPRINPTEQPQRCHDNHRGSEGRRTDTSRGVRHRRKDVGLHWGCYIEPNIEENNELLIVCVGISCSLHRSISFPSWQAKYFPRATPLYKRDILQQEFSIILGKEANTTSPLEEFWTISSPHQTLLCVKWQYKESFNYWGDLILYQTFKFIFRTVPIPVHSLIMT